MRLRLRQPLPAILGAAVVIAASAGAAALALSAATSDSEADIGNSQPIDDNHIAPATGKSSPHGASPGPRVPSPVATIPTPQPAPRSLSPHTSPTPPPAVDGVDRPEVGTTPDPPAAQAPPGAGMGPPRLAPPKAAPVAAAAERSHAQTPAAGFARSDAVSAAPCQQ